MAKLEKTLNKDFDTILRKIEEEIINGSVSASLEDKSDFCGSHSRCSVRVFERYSHTGGNRLSLSVTLYQNEGEPVRISAITAGGSNAIFFKLNTFGEEAFLEKLRKIIE